jgi:uncharacterized protein (TIGR02117 family)
MILMMLLGLLLAACGGDAKKVKLDNNTNQIYVVSQGWHTGLVVPSHSLPDSIWPEAYPFDEYPHLQVGWGDKDFYQNKEGFNPWYGIKAAAWPTESAVQVVGLRKITNLQYYANQTISLALDDQELDSLSGFILSEFAYDSTGMLIPLEDGLFGESRFFLGSRTYYFPRNSNVWTARALKQAGLDISPIWYQTHGSLMRRVREEGEVIYSDE